MSIVNKRNIFIFFGIVVIGVTFFLTKLTNVEASKKEGKKFDDWTISCTKDDSGNEEKLCFLVQQLNMTQDEKTQTLAVYQIGYIEGNLKIISTLPLGISVEAGTSIISSKNLLAKGRFTTCTAAGCQSVADITEDELSKIIATDENSLAFMNVEGKQINIPFYSKGLEKGLAFLKN